MIKDRINSALIAAVLAFVVYNAWSDTDEMHQHEAFFEKMIKMSVEFAEVKQLVEELQRFKSVGGRYTAADAVKDRTADKIEEAEVFEELCEKINEVAFDATERDLIDCEKYEDRPM